MNWYQPLPPALWWSFSVGVVLASFYVLVFLARHPVDGESRIMAWSQRNRVPVLVSGAVMTFVIMPNPIVLSALLALFLWIEHTEKAGRHNDSSPRASGQYY